MLIAHQPEYTVTVHAATAFVSQRDTTVINGLLNLARRDPKRCAEFGVPDKRPSQLCLLMFTSRSRAPTPPGSGLQINIDRCFDASGRINPFKHHGCCALATTVSSPRARFAATRGIIVATDAHAIDRIVDPHDDSSPPRALADEVSVPGQHLEQAIARSARRDRRTFRRNHRRMDSFLGSTAASVPRYSSLWVVRIDHRSPVQPRGQGAVRVSVAAEILRTGSMFFDDHLASASARYTTRNFPLGPTLRRRPPGRPRSRRMWCTVTLGDQGGDIFLGHALAIDSGGEAVACHDVQRSRWAVSLTVPFTGPRSGHTPCLVFRGGRVSRRDRARNAWDALFRSWVALGPV